MADVTPSAAIGGGSAVFTFGTETYHGITNYGWSGSVQEQVVYFSSSSGATSLTVTGGADDALTMDIVLGAGDATTPAALQRGESNSTCEFHPEGDSAGNIEIIFENGVVTRSDFNGSVNNAGILSLTIRCDGDLTIQDAV